MRPDKVHAFIRKLPGIPAVMAFPEHGHSHYVIAHDKHLRQGLRRFYTDRDVAVVATNKIMLLPDGVSEEAAWDMVMTYGKTTTSTD